MTTSLVCLSDDDFTTSSSVIFATISGQQNAVGLAGTHTGRGKLELDFEFGSCDDIIGKTFIMIEAPAFFQVYMLFLEIN